MISRKMIAGLGAAAGAVLLTGCATLEEAVAEASAETHRATLTHRDVVSSRGDSDGFARAELTVTDELNQVCYDLNDIRNLGPITSVTINRGAMGRTGPIVMRLPQANEGGWKGCVGRAEWLEDRFERAPGAYYIQVATTEFPNGAIRGQFRRD